MFAVCDFFTYLICQDHEASEEYLVMSLISTQIRILTIHWVICKQYKDNKHTIMHVWVSKVDANAFALCDLFKLFLHLCTNTGTVIEPGGVQLDTIIVYKLYQL